MLFKWLKDKLTFTQADYEAVQERKRKKEEAWRQQVINEDTRYGIKLVEKAMRDGKSSVELSYYEKESIDNIVRKLSEKYAWMKFTSKHSSGTIAGCYYNFYSITFKVKK